MTIVYILYYILAYIQHNRDVSLEIYVFLSAVASLRKLSLLHSKPESATASRDSCSAQSYKKIITLILPHIYIYIYIYVFILHTFVGLWAKVILFECFLSCGNWP